jgi:hypothetical protein
MIKLEEPQDVRQLIKAWLAEICDTGKLPFEGGGTVVQLLNVWLRSYEIEKVSDIEERITAMEESQAAIKEQYSELFKKGVICEKSE